MYYMYSSGQQSVAHHIWPFFINVVSAASVAFATIFGHKKRLKADWLGSPKFLLYYYTLAWGNIILVKKVKSHAHPTKYIYS